MISCYEISLCDGPDGSIDHRDDIRYWGPFPDANTEVGYKYYSSLVQEVHSAPPKLLTSSPRPAKGFKAPTGTILTLLQTSPDGPEQHAFAFDEHIYIVSGCGPHGTVYGDMLSHFSGVTIHDSWEEACVHSFMNLDKAHDVGYGHWWHQRNIYAKKMGCEDPVFNDPKLKLEYTTKAVEWIKEYATGVDEVVAMHGMINMHGSSDEFDLKSRYEAWQIQEEYEMLRIETLAEKHLDVMLTRKFHHDFKCLSDRAIFEGAAPVEKPTSAADFQMFGMNLGHVVQLPVWFNNLILPAEAQGLQSKLGPLSKSFVQKIIGGHAQRVQSRTNSMVSRKSIFAHSSTTAAPTLNVQNSVKPAVALTQVPVKDQRSHNRKILADDISVNDDSLKAHSTTLEGLQFSTLPVVEDLQPHPISTNAYFQQLARANPQSIIHFDDEMRPIYPKSAPVAQSSQGKSKPKPSESWRATPLVKPVYGPNTTVDADELLLQMPGDGHYTTKKGWAVPQHTDIKGNGFAQIPNRGSSMAIEAPAAEVTPPSKKRGRPRKNAAQDEGSPTSPTPSQTSSKGNSNKSPKKKQKTTSPHIDPLKSWYKDEVTGEDRYGYGPGLDGPTAQSGQNTLVNTASLKQTSGQAKYGVKPITAPVPALHQSMNSEITHASSTRPYGSALAKCGRSAPLTDENRRSVQSAALCWLNHFEAEGRIETQSPATEHQGPIGMADESSSSFAPAVHPPKSRNTSRMSNNSASAFDHGSAPVALAQKKTRQRKPSAARTSTAKNAINANSSGVDYHNDNNMNIDPMLLGDHGFVNSSFVDTDMNMHSDLNINMAHQIQFPINQRQNICNHQGQGRVAQPKLQQQKKPRQPKQPKQSKKTANTTLENNNVTQLISTSHAVQPLFDSQIHAPVVDHYAVGGPAIDQYAVGGGDANFNDVDAGFSDMDMMAFQNMSNDMGMDMDMHMNHDVGMYSDLDLGMDLATGMGMNLGMGMDDFNMDVGMVDDVNMNMANNMNMEMEMLHHPVQPVHPVQNGRQAIEYGAKKWRVDASTGERFFA